MCARALADVVAYPFSFVIVYYDIYGDYHWAAALLFSLAYLLALKNRKDIFEEAVDFLFPRRIRNATVDTAKKAIALMKRVATWLEFSNKNKQRITGNFPLSMIVIITTVQILWFSGIALGFFNSTIGLIIISLATLAGFFVPYVIAIRSVNRIPRSPNYEWVFLTIINMLSAGTGMSLIDRAFGTLTLLLALTVISSTTLVILKVRERWQKMKIDREKNPIIHLKNLVKWANIFMALTLITINLKYAIFALPMSYVVYELSCWMIPGRLRLAKLINAGSFTVTTVILFATFLLPPFL